MRIQIRRIISLVLAVVMTFSLGSMNVFAITETDDETITIGATSVNVEKSVEDQTAYISLYIDKDAEVSNYDVQVNIIDPNNVGISFAGGAEVSTASMSGQVNLLQGATTGGISVGDQNAQHHLTEVENLGYVFVKVPFNIPANTTGSVTVEFSALNIAEFDNASGYTLASDTVTATIEVTEPVDTSNPMFTVYYEIDGTDSDNDNFFEYDPGVEVAVDIYVKADSTQTMQAFDIYPKWDTTALEYASVTAADGFEIVNEMTAAQPHFLTNMTATGGSIDQTVGTDGVKVATLKLNFSKDVIYDTQYSVWFDDATNLAKAKDAESVENVTVTAQGEIGVETLKIYTLTYDQNTTDEVTGMPDPVTANKPHNAKLTLSSAKPERSGYSFLGWDTNVDATTATYSAGGELPADINDEDGITLYAVWKANTHTVTWKNFDGSDFATTTVTHGEKPYDPGTPTHIKEGYTTEFKGWATSAGQSSGKQVSELDAVTTDGIIYYAAFTETVNKYTIAFDTDGGTTINPITQDFGTDVTAPTDPTKTGYTFAGWVDADGKAASVPATMPAGDMTLKATWTINQYTITFNTDGGTEIVPIKQDYATAVTAPANPTKIGYTFASWDKTIPATMPAEDVTITAQWTINQYTITLKDTDGTTIKTITQDYDSEVTAPAYPTKEGYTFAGWSPELPDMMPAINTEVTANWTANTYKVTLDPNGGELEKNVTNPFDVTFDSTYGTLPTPTRGGYDFAGWHYTDAEQNETKIEADSKVTVAADHTLIAKWNPLTYKVTFDPANGEAVTTQEYNTAVGFTTPAAPSYEFHTFKGWLVTATDGTWPASNYNASTEASGYYGNVTLTAQWEGALAHEVEDYKYAPQNYVMLRIATTEDNTLNYTFGDIVMYYTDDTNYLLDGSPVLVTLIPVDNGKEGEELVSYISGNQLTDAGLAMLEPATGTAATIDRTSGLINNDDVVNIADANAVYQMVQFGGQYYGLDQLTILQRLKADMVTDYVAGDARGTIEDVNAIIEIINNNANTTNP